MKRFKITEKGNDDFKSAHHIYCNTCEQTTPFTVKIENQFDIVFMDEIIKVEEVNTSRTKCMNTLEWFIENRKKVNDTIEYDSSLALNIIGVMETKNGVNVFKTLIFNGNYFTINRGKLKMWRWKFL
jgi:hypothetical protein